MQKSAEGCEEKHGGDTLQGGQLVGVGHLLQLSKVTFMDLLPVQGEQMGGFIRRMDTVAEVAEHQICSDLPRQGPKTKDL